MAEVVSEWPESPFSLGKLTFKGVLKSILWMSTALSAACQQGRMEEFLTSMRNENPWEGFVTSI